MLLPVKIGSMRGSGNAPLTSISYIDSTTSSTNTITGSASILQGDFLLLWDCANGGSLPASTYPSGDGFSLASDFSDGVNNHRCIISYKIASGTEASGSFTGMDGSSAERKILAVFRGDVKFTSATFNDLSTAIGSSNPASQNCSAASGAAPLIVFGLYWSTGAVTTRSISPGSYTGELSSTTRQYMNYLIYNSSPASQDIDMGDDGINGLASFYVTFNGA